MGRRQGARRENVLRGPLTDEQRSRRPIFGETRRAEVLLPLRFVAPPSQIPADMLRRRFACKAQIPLSGGVHSFLSGCYGRETNPEMILTESLRLNEHLLCN